MSKILWFKKNFTRLELFFLIVGASIPTILLIALVTFRVNTYSREQKIRDAWKIRVLDRYKDLETNTSAQRLEELTSQIGIDLTPATMNGRRPAKDLQNRFNEMNKLIRTYIQAQFSKDDSGIDPFPNPILHYCKAYRSTIREIVTLINSNPAPKWSMRISDPNGPWPNLLGHINLERILVLQILQAIKSDDSQEAASAFRAMDTLNRTILDRPELMSNLIALLVIKHELGIIRKWPWKLTDDQEKILNQSYRQNFLDGLFCERVGYAIHIMDNPQLHFFNPKWYVKSAAIDIGEKNLERMKIVSSVGDCSILPSTVDRISFARWNRYAEYVTNERERWAKYLHAMIDIEFTRRIVDLKQAGQELGRWPSAFPKPSVITCQSATISYHVDADDTATIAIQNVPVSEDDNISLLSRSFRLSKTELIVHD